MDAVTQKLSQRIKLSSRNTILLALIDSPQPIDILLEIWLNLNIMDAIDQNESILDSTWWNTPCNHTMGLNMYSSQLHSILCDDNM